MRIAWIADPRLLEFTADDVGSRLASYRYRMLIPRLALQQRGHAVQIIPLDPQPGSFERAVEQLHGADVAIFGKTSHWDLNERLLAAAQQINVTAVADFCDDYFDHRDRVGEHFREMAMRADAISVSTPFLARRVAEAAARDAAVIPDPYEGPRGPAKWAPGAPLRALWFGHSLNFPGLQKSLDAIVAAGIPMRLVVMTMNLPDVLQWCAANSAPAPHFALEFREWSLQGLWQSLRECDVALIPVEPAQQFNLAKGHNRVVEPLWAGRFVVANPVPAYAEFSDWAWIGDDLAAGLRWAMEHPADVVARINRAQKDILARLSPLTIAKAWEKMLKSARRGKKFSAPSKLS